MNLTNALYKIKCFLVILLRKFVLKKMNSSKKMIN